MITVLFLSTLLVSTLALLQSTWLSGLSLLGASPDLPMLVLAWVAFNNENVEGPVSGFFGGLVEDAISAVPLGFHAFSRSLTALVAWLLHGGVKMDGIVLPLLFGIAGTVLKAVSGIVVNLLFGVDGFLYNLGEPGFWVEMGMNALIAPVVFFLMSRVSRYFISAGRASD